jgi:acetyl esterase/lipase
MRYINLALGLALLISSCTKSDVGKGVTTSNDSLPAVSYLNQSYGTDGEQKLDVYLPALRSSKTRMLIIIHGGGWSSGDKSDFDSYIGEFQKRFPYYAFANLNYRLAKETGNYFPTQENDIQAAIQYLKNKTSEFKISNDFVFLGISAGAHLALLQGYKHSDELQPKGIISFFGPVDLQLLYTDANSDKSIPYVLKSIMNTTLEGNPDIFQQSSPINYVNSSSAPTLMLHGDADKLVPVDQAYMLRDKLVELGVTNKLVVYPGQGHGWIGADLTDSFNQVETFIRGLEN